MTTKLEAIRQREQAATEGPWHDCGGGVRQCSCGLVWSKPHDFPVASTDTDDDIEGFSSNTERKALDANFIAHARTDIPTLLAAAEAAAAFVARWDDRVYTDAADMVGHCWETIASLRAALAPLLEPEG